MCLAGLVSILSAIGTMLARVDLLFSSLIIWCFINLLCDLQPRCLGKGRLWKTSLERNLALM